MNSGLKTNNYGECAGTFPYSTPGPMTVETGRFEPIWQKIPIMHLLFNDRIVLKKFAINSGGIVWVENCAVSPAFICMQRQNLTEINDAFALSQVEIAKKK